MKSGVACIISEQIMSSSDSCKDGASKLLSNDDGVCKVNDMLQNMSVGDVSVCANCGKEGSSDNMNLCNKCKVTTYCNAVCKKVHKKKHKKDCEEYIRLATEKHDEEIRLAAELHDIELFKQPPQLYKDCPICFLRMPSLETGYRYMPCCGKEICSGCVHSPVYDNQGNVVFGKKCAFCRTPHPTSDDEIRERVNKRVEVEDPLAIHKFGVNHRDGADGFPQDYAKALNLYHRAGELGHIKAYTNIGNSYYHGRGVEVDEKKANHYYELAAMGGDSMARHNLGNNEVRAGSFDRALKQYMIAVRSGTSNSLEVIKEMYSNGYATKDEYMKALQLYQEYLSEIKSSQRDEAAAADEANQYY